MKLAGKRPLSFLLSLCMVLTMLPAITTAASADDGQVTVGNESTPVATAYTGTGWSWKPTSSNASGTLTLSGVNLSGGIYLPWGTTLVLEGTNRITGTVTDRDKKSAALYCDDSLTVSGSGILKIEETDCRKGIEAYGLTFNSGEVDVSINYSGSNPAAIYCQGSRPTTIRRCSDVERRKS